MYISESEFKDIYNEFYGKISCYLERLVGKSESEDLTQEVFAKVGKNLGGFKGNSKLSTWIYRIASNSALDMLSSRAFRQNKKLIPLSGIAGDMDTDIDEANTYIGKKATSASQQVIKKEMTQCIREFIDRLPDDYRMVIILSELEELKNREIAEILEISLDTVKIRLHRARAKLKKELEAGCTFYHENDSGLACDRKE